VTSVGSPVTLRPARLDDAEAIRQIYNAEVLTSTVTFDIAPRSLDEQRRYLGDRSGVHAVVVATEGGVVVGYGALSPWRSKPAYATSVEDSVYVHRDHQGRGIGRTLLTELLAVATAHGFHAVFARIVGHHEGSIRLHEALGFEIVGTEREVGRKFGRWLDVVVMEAILPNPAAPRLLR
jgi:L-amino acid N-acyltransferase YncA